MALDLPSTVKVIKFSFGEVCPFWQITGGAGATLVVHGVALK